MLRANDLRENVHIRLIAYLGGDDELAQTGPVGLIAGALPRGSPKGVTEGIHVRVGSWARLADNALPPRVKCTGNYVNNRAAEIEARQDGYDGVIMLTAAGKVSEGSGACLFIARHGRLHTPDLASDILESITRDTMLQIAPATIGSAVVERTIDRSELYAGRRDVLVRLGPGDHADPLGRPHPGRRRPDRPADPRAAGALLPHRAWRGRRPARLADPGLGERLRACGSLTPSAGLRPSSSAD